MKNTIFTLILVVLQSSVVFSQGVDHWRIGNPYVSRTDAAFSFSDDYASLISGKNILFEPMVLDQNLRSISNSISDDLFPDSYKFKPISAALDVDDEKLYLFKGNVYVKKQL